MQPADFVESTTLGVIGNKADRLGKPMYIGIGLSVFLFKGEAYEEKANECPAHGGAAGSGAEAGQLRKTLPDGAEKHCVYSDHRGSHRRSGGDPVAVLL